MNVVIFVFTAKILTLTVFISFLFSVVPLVMKMVAGNTMNHDNFETNFLIESAIILSITRFSL